MDQWVPYYLWVQLFLKDLEDQWVQYLKQFLEVQLLL
jgi:hypothetical protein